MTSPQLEKKWFLQFQGRVEGPYHSEKLQSALQEIGDAHLSKALLWKRGLTEWMKASKWQPGADAIDTPTQTASPTAVFASDAPEKTLAQTMTENAFYRVQVNFVEQPLMTKAELLALISKQPDVAAIAIQHSKTKEWKEVYAFPDLVERLGLTRRGHQRVPILAQFTGSSNKNAQLNARIITISEGGVGFTENFELKIGDSIEGQITSPHFFQPIRMQADVIYSGLDGYVGLKFSQITDEAKSAIIDYTKKFGKGSNSL